MLSDNVKLTQNSRLKINDLNLPLLAISLIYYGIIIFLAAKLNIWEDEVYSLNTSSGSLAYAFHQSLYFELQPPVYFLLLTLWRTISDSILWARLLSVLLIILSQFILYRFTKKLAGQKIATIISILFILNPATVFTILEIRTFVLVIFLSIAISITFYETYYKNRINFYWRSLFILLAVLGIFTQYFIGFLLFANAVFLLFERKWKPLRYYLVDMILPLLLIIIFIPKILWASNVQGNFVPEYNRTFIDFLFEIKDLMGQITFRYFLPSGFIDSKVWQWVFKIFFIILLAFSIKFFKVKKALIELFPFLFISAIIFLFFVAVLSLFGRYVLAYKYTLVLFVTIGVALIFFFRNIRPGLLNFWLILLAFVYVSENTQIYHQLYKKKDFKSLGNYIAETEENEEPVFVFRNISAEILQLYYKGKNKIYPLPRDFAYDKDFDPRQWEITVQDINELNGNLLNYSHFYIVIDNSPLRGVNESKSVLLDFVQSNYKLVFKKTFEHQINLYKFSNKGEE